VIPYVKGISEVSTSLINKSITVGFRWINWVNLRVQKNKTELVHKSNIIYKITCKNCDVPYIGKTKR